MNECPDPVLNKTTHEENQVDLIPCGEPQPPVGSPVLPAFSH